MISARNKNQYLTTFFICLQKISIGSMMLWISPALLELTSETAPLLTTGPITPLQISWLLSSLTIGHFLGAFFYGAIVDKIGRKSCLLLSALGQIISISLSLVPKNLLILCISRFILGWLDFGGSLIHFIFVQEIADNLIRGRLLNLLTISLICGSVLVLLLANLCNYYVYSCAFIGFPILSFLTLFFLIPDSPQGLLARNKVEEVEKSIQFYRNDKNLKLSQWNNSVINNQKEKISIWKELKCKSVQKAFLIGTVLHLFSVFGGLGVMINMSGIIFRDTGSVFSPNMSSALLYLLKLLGSILSTVLVDRVGRKVLLAFSGFGLALGNIGLGVHMFCKEELLIDLSSYSWISLTCFSVAVFAASCGIFTLYNLVCQEIFPARILIEGNVYLRCLDCTFSIIMEYVFPMLSVAVGMHYCLFFFAICSFGGAFFSIFVLPETKGKSLEEIEMVMK